MTTSQNLTFPAPDGVTLAGTLELPDGPGPHPAALLIVGSGEVDRDSDHAKLRLGVTRELAAALTRAGIATLRFDKRGVGASGGDHLSTTFDEAREDAAAALAALRADPAVDPARVLIVGHSEGAIHAAAIAATDDRLAGVALLSGQAGTGEATLRWQAAAIVPTLPRFVRGLLKLLRQSPERAQDQLFAKLRASDENVLRVQGKRLNAGWLRGFLDHDTADALARIAVPVLALTGDRDLQADPADLDRMRELVPGAIETHLVPELNHLLRHTEGSGSPTRYKKQLKAGQPVDDRVVQTLVAWATARTAVGS